MSAALLWDLDGTLVDSRLDLAAAGNVARDAIGLQPLAIDTIMSYVGDGVARLLQRLCGEVDAATFARAERAFHEHYARHCVEQTRPFAGIPEVLAQLQERGWRHGVVTNKPDDYSARILAELGLARWVPAICGGDQLRKPDPEPLRQVLAALDCHVDGSWMIGDHHTDIRAGRAAGMRVAFCSYGLGSDDGEHCDARIAAPDELPAALGWPPPG